MKKNFGKPGENPGHEGFEYLERFTKFRIQFLEIMRRAHSENVRNLPLGERRAFLQDLHGQCAALLEEMRAALINPAEHKSKVAMAERQLQALSEMIAGLSE